MAAKRAAAKVVDPLARLEGRVIAGDGPRPCRILACGECGGKDEMRTGKPFTGPSGQLLWSPNPAQFPGICDPLGLPRASLYLTNVIKRHIRDDRDPNPSEIAYFRPELLRELREVQPEFIIAIGGFATRWFLGPDVSMDLVHGLPHWSSEFSLPVIPCLHPAAGLHDTDSMPAVYWDYAQAAAFIRGDIGLHQVEQEVTRLVPLPEHLPEGAYALGIDTESRADGSPLWMQVSWEQGTAALIRADDHDAIARVLSWSRDPSLLIFMHFAMHDVKVCREMGADMGDCLLWTDGQDTGSEQGARLIDTMVLAFNRGKIDTQGLKALAYRRLNRKMRDYLDVVGPYQQALSRTYLERALIEGYAGAYPDPPQTCAVVDGKLKFSQPWTLTKRIERILSDGDKDAEGTDLRARWLGIDEEWREQATRILGPMPEADLTHVEQASAYEYALQDPDMTRRLGLLFWAEHHTRDLVRIVSVDHGALPLTERMQSSGLPANRQYFIDLGQEMQGLQAELAELLEAIVGYPVNPNSSPQVAELVYNTLGLESVKSTPSGKPSTGKKALQHLRAHPLVEWILRSREFDKLDSSFCGNIERRIGTDGRCRTQLMTTRVKTGRMASKNPNLLAIPTRTKLGNRVRGGFIAPPGHVLATFDLSQVELRILAHLSRDPWMVEIYNRGPEFPKWERDIHVMTAARVWGVNGQDVKKESRTAVKCFHPDTEVLTKTGWKRIPDLVTGEEVIQALPSDGGSVRLEWVVPTDMFTQAHPSGQLVHLQNKGLDLRVTPDHRMLGWLANGRWFVTSPATLDTRARVWANAGLLHAHDRPKFSLPLLRVAVALQADGSIDEYGNIRWGFTKRRKIERLTALLKLAELPFTCALYHNGKNPLVSSFKVKAVNADHLRAQLDSDKTLPWKWLGLPLAARQAIVEEAQFWDSHVITHRFFYGTTIEKNADVLQALAATCGRKSRKTVDMKTRSPKHASVFSLSVSDHHLSRSGNLASVTQQYTGEVACLSVPSSFVLVRDGGVTAICGQSCNFGIAMGMTGHGLAEQMRLYGLDPAEWTVDRCDKLIEEVLDLWRGVRDYQFQTRAEARRYGYVTSLYGRRFDLPQARCPLSWIREEALRQSHALCIQGGAQDLFKLASRTIYTDLMPAIQNMGVYFEPLLQVHDETLIETEEGMEQTVTPMMIQCLTTAAKLLVPMEAGSAWGQSWGALEK